MGDTLVSKKVNLGLNLIIQKLFLGNRILDRQMSQLSVKFVMNNTSNHLHPLLAHAFPVLADDIGDYQDDRNVLTEYLDTPTNNTDYKDPIELFSVFYGYTRSLEETIVTVIDMATTEKDIMTRIMLEHFLLKISKYTAQAKLLLDKANAYDGKWMDFDRDIENFLIVERLKAK